ncbi:hypothetical protein E2C01_001629 [Portunus trituberculatus]|uniref:Uncharacterized protein n=1 Tax=Portunus trituberculatus TaxID=210409 RepID=A0A5B7CHN6_PORTR|nr:hypothetical protein [Portunus trituberculatus]
MKETVHKGAASGAAEQGSVSATPHLKTAKTTVKPTVYQCEEVSKNLWHLSCGCRRPSLVCRSAYPSADTIPCCKTSSINGAAGGSAWARGRLVVVVGLRPGSEKPKGTWERELCFVPQDAAYPETLTRLMKVCEDLLPSLLKVPQPVLYC